MATPSRTLGCNPNLFFVVLSVVGPNVTARRAGRLSKRHDGAGTLSRDEYEPNWRWPLALGGYAIHVKTAHVEPLRDAWTDLKGTLLLVGGTLLAAVLAVGVSLAVRSTGPAGDVVAKTTNFRISMPKTLRAGRHTFA